MISNFLKYSYWHQQPCFSRSTWECMHA